ncbi:CLUMA_CG019074, isoform A [Clunio marinus]|uniref:CLUMA_CG019074, isoform A n=1 Tax=Clunio marinus TaxID=568069 RepID=A0A1J1J3G8_9DIPT|nr:CLUMA_CG019074, isoform A [Clunio marinus]
MVKLQILLAVGIALLKSSFTSGETYTFPEGFKIGAASASYQIEGGWNEDGKSPSIWDTITQNQVAPCYIEDCSSGNVAADSYHMYEKDLQALEDVGFEVYRFSISWSRIIPDGAEVNMKGIEYYHKIIDGLIERGIKPLVTIYHWDLPQYIQDLGGWTNPLIVDYFAVYADVLFEHYGDKVKDWITFNEPSVFCGEGYGSDTKAPAIPTPGIGDYLCAHHVLLSNAAAYKLYRNKYYNDQQGRVGICLNAGFSYPFDETVDPSIPEKAIQFDLGKFANPIFSKDGGYPDVMVQQIGSKSMNEGRRWSRLPEMTQETKDYIRGTADFLALNYYSSGLAKQREGEPDGISWWADTDLDGGQDPSWKRAKSTWLFRVPQGLQDLLVWIKDRYDNPEVMITENGWSDDGQLDDDDRVEYLQAHLAAVIRAVRDDQCHVTAYTVWSLTDNFEWKMGYTERFGIHYIDFDSADKERVPKKSAQFFKDMIPTKTFEYEVSDRWG